MIGGVMTLTFILSYVVKGEVILNNTSNNDSKEPACVPVCINDW